jgi:hypothetical protein
MTTLSTSDYLALSEPNLSYYANKECHVCYEKISAEKAVTCKNGHTCCQKHHLERVRAIYQQGDTAYGGMDDRGGNNGQNCFMCRCEIGDARFSRSFFKVLRVIQAVEIPKMMGVNIHPSEVIEAADEVYPLKR